MPLLDALIRDADQFKVELFLKLSQNVLISFVGDLDKLVKSKAVAIGILLDIVESFSQVGI